MTAFKVLQEVAQSLTSELDLSQLLSKILQSAVDVVQASAGSLLLFDSKTNELVFQVVQGGSGESLLNVRFPSNQGIAGSAFTNVEPTIVHDVRTDDRFLQLREAAGFAIDSLMAVPMVQKGKPIGVIEVLNKKMGGKFNADDQELLLAFAAQSAVAIENARLYAQVVADRDRVVSIEDEVRRELARDLHDGPSQLLSALIMNLRFLKEVIVRSPERSREEVDNVERLAVQALHQIRNMLFDLRPVLLETQGLAAALSAYVDRQRENKDIEILLEINSLSARLPSKAEAAIFSIIQEAVGNVRKHANAKHIWITAEQRKDKLTVTVQDDGCGFDVQQMEEAYAQRGSLGLLNMKERADIANAELKIDSEPGKGTQVKLTIPLVEPETG
ncbi:MAG TPA: GAF domain-containing sensor histidine kinase [Anaerolineae bacterium]